MAKQHRWPLTARLPQQLGEALLEAAARRYVSLNGLVALLLTEASGHGLERLEEGFRLELSIDGVAVASPLRLLQRAFALPIRFGI